MDVYTTEIASAQIPSDNPIHQRLLSAYHHAKPYISGKLLELGCGEGRGVEILAPLAESYLGMDKIQSIIHRLAAQYPNDQFQSATFPPLPFEDAHFDTIVSFQVIEHIKKDEKFIEEIFRVLKPGGVALITTPNHLMTLSRNPWHIREYTAEKLIKMSLKYFQKVEMKGIAGNDKVMEYHEQNRQSVNKIMKYDILNLQYRLPAAMLTRPYEIINRMNRKKLKAADSELVRSIKWQDFELKKQNDQNLDLFCILKK